MKIILSRKGFDAKNGRFQSPILPDGTMLSMPIPGSSEDSYADIEYNGLKYSELLNQLKPKNIVSSSQCHLDPDIRAGIRIKSVDNWRPAFGQAGGPQTHLENYDVGLNDIFLFFGWFKETEIGSSGRLRYKRSAPDIQAIYGYMQIGDMLKGDRIRECSWHPHANEVEYMWTNNTLYIPTSELTINNQSTGFPGYGTLKYSSQRVLTKPGLSRSKWSILDWFHDVSISHHSKESFKDGYFQSACIGQEFIITANDEAINWARQIISGTKL